MRALIGTFLLLLLPTLALCQDTNAAEEAIGRIINSGLLEGHDQKLLGGTGDNAAVIVTKVVGDKKLSGSQIERVLLVLTSAFGDISATPDREPRTTLFVLRTLELSTADPELRKKILAAKQYIKDSFTKSMKK